MAQNVLQLPVSRITSPPFGGHFDGQVLECADILAGCKDRRRQAAELHVFVFLPGPGVVDQKGAVTSRLDRDIVPSVSGDDHK